MRFIALTLLILAAPLAAAPPTPQEEVLRLVPPDTAVCFVVQNLRDRAATVAASPFAKWAGEKLNAKVAGIDDFKMLQSMLGVFERELGLTVHQLRDDVLGDIFVHAYQPAHSSKNLAEQSVFLLHARDAGKMQSLLEKLNALQKTGGELKELKPQTYEGLAYTIRVKSNGENEYYRINDRMFIFASSETALKAVMDRELAKPTTSPIITALADRGAANAFLACVIQPRAFDGQLSAADATDTEAEKAGKAQMAKLWLAMDQCVIYLSADAELELGVSVAYRGGDLPKELKSFLAAAPKRSPLWQAVPADSLFAVAVQAETNVLLDAIGSFLPAADRPKLRKQFEDVIGPVVGKAKLEAVMTGLGPDIGLWAAPSQSNWFPRVVAALHLKAQPDPQVPAQVRRLSGFYLQAFQVNYNRTHGDQMEFIEETVGGVELRRLVNDKLFPPGVSPTIAVHDGFLIAASSPEAVTAFKAPLTAETPRNEAPVLTVSAKEIHKLLTAHKGEAAKWIAAKQDRETAAVAKEIDTLLPILEAFDRIDIVVRGDDKSRTLALKVKTVKALK